MRPIRFLAAIALFATTFPVLAADQSYTLKLDRPWHVGDVCDTHMVFTNSTTTTITLPDQPVQNQKDSTSGDFTGRIQVNAVDSKGHSTAFSITVRKLTPVGDSKELLPAGTVIDAKQNDTAVNFSLRDGGKLGDDALSTLKVLFGFQQENAPSDDDIYGSRQPHKPGDSWSINSEIAANSMANSQLKVDPANLTGSCTLKGVEIAREQPAIRVQGSMSGKNFQPTSVPTGVTVEQCDASIHYEALFPVDTGLPRLDLQTTSDIHIVMSGGPMRVDVQIQGSQKETITPVKK